MRPGGEQEYAEYSASARWIILISLMLAAIMQIVDTSIVNVAIPQMMGNLGVSVDQIGWVSTGYIISMVIVLPLTGWLSATFGRKRYLTGSIIVFTVCSFLCGMSWNLSSLVFFRILQGAGGAALISTAQATMMEVFPPEQVPMVQAVFGLGIIVGPTVGPALGGWITDCYSWPWIFFINIPVGILAAVLAYMFVHDSKFQKTKGGLDILGIGLLAIGLASLQTVLEKGNRESWFESAMIVRLTVIAVVGLAVFLVWELRVPNPVVDLRVLKNRGLAAGSLFAAVMGFGMYGGIFVLPIFLQGLQHFTAQQSGWVLFPGGLACAVAMPIVGKLSSRVFQPILVAIGSLGFVVSMLLMRTLTSDTGAAQLFWPLVMRGAAMGFLGAPLALAALTGLHNRDLAHGAGMFNLARQIGGSFGIAVLSTVLDHRTAVHRASLVEYVTIHNPVAMQHLSAVSGAMTAQGSPVAIAKLQAYSLINGAVQSQAAVLAFRDIFTIIAVFFVASMPLLLLFRRNEEE